MHPTTPALSDALSGPLRIDRIALDNAGVIGMTHCPGRCTVDPRGRAWRRVLSDDVAAIREAGFGTVLTLLPDHELQSLGAGALGLALQHAGVRWLRFPIADFGVPDAQAQTSWRAMQTGVVAQLRLGEQVLVHCAAGLGRTGTMVATLLKALGDDSETAIAKVRSARPGTIETPAQHAFVVGLDT